MKPGSTRKPPRIGSLRDIKDRPGYYVVSAVAATVLMVVPLAIAWTRNPNADPVVYLKIMVGTLVGLLALNGLMFIILYVLDPGLLTRNAASDARKNLDQAVENVADPNDLLKLMEVNRRQMEAYDVQARAQGRSSHRSSLLAMTAGLAIVGAGLWITVNADDSATKYSAAIVAAVGTATGGYIARTFIRVNSSAQQHVRFYFEQPLVQSYLLTAERVAERLPDRKRERQYELIVAAALHRAGMVSQQQVGEDESEEEPEPGPVDDPASADEKPSGGAGEE